MTTTKNDNQPEDVKDLIKIQNADYFYKTLKDKHQHKLFDDWNLSNLKSTEDNEIIIALRWQLKMAIRKICIERGMWNYSLKKPLFSKGELPFET